jgi:hypothetical protein
MITLDLTDDEFSALLALGGVGLLTLDQLPKSVFESLTVKLRIATDKLRENREQQ